MIPVQQDAFSRILEEGLKSGGSFKATIVTNVGGAVSASLEQDMKRPDPRPQTARTTKSTSSAPVAQHFSISPASACQFGVAQPEPAKCKFFAAGCCKKGDICPFKHSIEQEVLTVSAIVQLPQYITSMLNTDIAPHHHERPSSKAPPRAARPGAEKPVSMKMPKAMATAATKKTEAEAAAAATAREAEVAAAAAAAAAAATCGACQDNCSVTDCIQCAGGHAVCKACFVHQIASQTGGDVRDKFIQTNCLITCAFCSVPIRDRDFISLVADDAFQLLTRARDEVTEVRTEQRLRADFEARIERLKQELARGQEAHERNVSRHRLHIAENILTLKCPRAQCRKAFVDYSNCMALTCSCGCGFCAWCLQDCGGDAHAHVLQCPHNALRGSYGGSFDQFETVHRNRVRPLVLQYLDGIPQTEAADVRWNDSLEPRVHVASLCELGPNCNCTRPG